jgi:AcrR family transcriptional regulator
MPIPPRILRAEIEDIPGARPKLNARERERQQVILTAGRRVLVNHGAAAIRLTDLATALGMSPGTIRRYFPDLDYLLGEILRAHLLALSSAIGQALHGIPFGAPHRQGTARAAYVAATRTILGGLTEGHLLLVRERHTLPPDQLATIEQLREGLGEVLAGELGHAALALLDKPEFSAAQVEAMLRTLAAPARTAPRLRIIPPSAPEALAEEPSRENPKGWGECATPPGPKVDGGSGGNGTFPPVFSSPALPWS